MWQHTLELLDAGPLKHMILFIPYITGISHYIRSPVKYRVGIAHHAHPSPDNNSPVFSQAKVEGAKLYDWQMINCSIHWTFGLGNFPQLKIIWHVHVRLGL